MAPKLYPVAGSGPPCIYARGANPDFCPKMSQNRHPKGPGPKKQLNCKKAQKPPTILKK